MSTRARTTAARRLATLQAGGIPQVTEKELWHGEVGQVPGVEERAILALARALNRANENEVSISWARQVQAMKFHNEHGLAATLREVQRLEALAR